MTWYGKMSLIQSEDDKIFLTAGKSVLSSGSNLSLSDAAIQKCKAKPKIDSGMPSNDTFTFSAVD